MAATLSLECTKPSRCKHLHKLPPVVSDWQQTCMQPNCAHYCGGQCFNPGRQSACAKCFFDDRELLLQEAEFANLDDATAGAALLQLGASFSG